MFKHIESENFSYKKNKNILSKAKNLYEKFSNIYPENFMFHRVMSRAYIYNCKREFINCHRKLINISDKRIKELKNKFEIIEPGYALTTIGSIFTLDAYIKSIKLNFSSISQLILPFPQKHRRPVNPTLLRYLSKHVKVIKSPKESKKYVKFLNKNRCLHDHFINTPNNQIPFAHTASVYIENEWAKSRKKPLFILSKADFIKGRKILNKMGIKKNSWFVTTHVRDESFKGKEGYRDSDINTFSKAYTEVINSGGYVIRMGNANMKNIKHKFQNDKFIDYARSKFKSHFMDIFLCASAKFMLGTSSGLSAVSYVFKVPIVLVNYAPTAQVYLRKGDIFLPPIFRNITTNKKLSFKKTMSPPFSLGISDGIYKNILNVKLDKNSDEDIRLVTKEMLDNLLYKKRYSKIENQLQRKFRRITLKGNALIESNIPIACRIGKDFLKKNHQLLQ